MKEITISLTKKFDFPLKLKYNINDVFITFENFPFKIKIKGPVFTISKKPHNLSPISSSYKNGFKGDQLSLLKYGFVLKYISSV